MPLIFLKRKNSVRMLSSSFWTKLSTSPYKKAAVCSVFYGTLCFVEVFEKSFNVKPVFLGFLSCKQIEKSDFYPTPQAALSQLAAPPALSAWHPPSIPSTNLHQHCYTAGCSFYLTQGHGPGDSKDPAAFSQKRIPLALVCNSPQTHLPSVGSTCIKN